MSTKAKNFIAQKVMSVLLLILSIVALPWMDYDATVHVFLVPLCLYVLFTRKVVVDMFRD